MNTKVDTLLAGARRHWWQRHGPGVAGSSGLGGRAWRCGAMRAAEKADKDRARGVSRGPLHGVPLAHKDAFDVAGRYFDRLCRCLTFRPWSLGRQSLASRNPPREGDSVASMQSIDQIAINSRGGHLTAHLS